MMYKLCKTEESAARQRELEQGLLAAMLVQQYEDISVSDLCDQMKVPRKSFYRYFSGKQGALYALMDHTVMEYESYSPSGNLRKLQNHKSELENYFSYWKSQKALLEALVKSNLEGTLIMRAVNHAITDLGIPNRILMQDTDVLRENAMTFAVCGLMSLVLKWYNSGFEMDVEQLASIAVELVTKPLFIPDRLL